MVKEEKRAEYHVDRIVDESAGDNGKPIFLVAWTGYPRAKARTWEPLSHVQTTIAYDIWMHRHDGLKAGAKKKELKLSGKGRQSSLEYEVPSDSDDQDYTPKREKAIAASKGVKGRLGDKLARKLARLPEEIRQIIFSQLTPKDLLVLARTSRKLRDVFMSREATGHLWAAAEKRWHDEGLPEYPDMNGPKLAALICDPICSLCWKHRANVLDWGLRRRMCEICGKASLIGKLFVKQRLPDFDDDHKDFATTTNHTKYSTNGGYGPKDRWYCLVDLVQASREATEAEEDEDVDWKEWWKQRVALVKFVESSSPDAAEWYSNVFGKLDSKARIITPSYSCDKHPNGYLGDKIKQRRKQILAELGYRS